MGLAGVLLFRGAHRSPRLGGFRCPRHCVRDCGPRRCGQDGWWFQGRRGYLYRSGGECRPGWRSHLRSSRLSTISRVVRRRTARHFSEAGPGWPTVFRKGLPLRSVGRAVCLSRRARRTAGLQFCVFRTSPERRVSLATSRIAARVGARIHSRFPGCVDCTLVCVLAHVGCAQLRAGVHRVRDRGCAAR